MHWLLFLSCADCSLSVSAAASPQRRAPPLWAAPQVAGLLRVHPVSSTSAQLHQLQGSDGLRPRSRHRHGPQEPRGDGHSSLCCLSLLRGLVAAFDTDTFFPLCRGQSVCVCTHRLSFWLRSKTSRRSWGRLLAKRPRNTTSCLWATVCPTTSAGCWPPAPINTESCWRPASLVLTYPTGVCTSAAGSPVDLLVKLS